MQTHQNGDYVLGMEQVLTMLRQEETKQRSLPAHFYVQFSTEMGKLYVVQPKQFTFADCCRKRSENESKLKLHNTGINELLNSNPFVTTIGYCCACIRTIPIGGAEVRS